MRGNFDGNARIGCTFLVPAAACSVSSIGYLLNRSIEAMDSVLLPLLYLLHDGIFSFGCPTGSRS